MSKLLLLIALLLLTGQEALAADHIVDDFESQQKWEVKEWGDAAQLSLDTNYSSEGKKSLSIVLLPEGKKPDNKGLFLRRSLSGRPDRLEFIELDLYSALSQPVEFALALEADEFYEAPKIKLQPGWNRKIHIDLTSHSFKSASSQWEYKTAIHPGVALGTIFFVIYTGDIKDGKFWIDQVKTAELNEPRILLSQSLVAQKAPSDLKIMSLAKEIAKAEKFEVKFDFQGIYSNPYDPHDIETEAVFFSPSGRVLKMPGFLASGEVSLRGPVRDPVWMLRISPDEVGDWSWYLRVKNAKGETRSALAKFKVKPSDNPGFVRVDRQDPHYFSFDSGQFYYPIGHNMAWDSDENYAKNFASMHAAGENWSRIWMSNWSFGLEWKEMGFFQGLGNYNLANAKRLDSLLELAKKSGIYLQLVFDFHGALSSKVNAEWPNNPYNITNGGMLKDPSEFWSNLEARAIYKNRVRYIVARWGFSQQVMAWELFNEINFSDNFPAEKESLWVKDISSYIKDIDPHKHLITTSYYDYYNKSTYELPTIDFTQYHAYQKRVVKTMQNVVQRFRAFNKPFIFAEFGNNSADGVDDRDKKGIFLHAGIWGQAMQPFGGNAMPWWWNTHIAPNNLYFHFKALAAFLEGVDRRGKDWQTVRETWTISRRLGLKETLHLHALRSRDLSLGWIVDARALSSDDAGSFKDWNELKFKLNLSHPGLYKVEYWDTEKGQKISGQDLESKDGQLVLAPPKFHNDIAFKIIKQTSAAKTASQQ